VPGNHDLRVEPPISHGDVTTIMGMLGDIRRDVQRIRILLEEDDGEEEEESGQSDA
jgi:C4-type Zn-finger protein